MAGNDSSKDDTPAHCVHAMHGPRDSTSVRDTRAVPDRSAGDPHITPSAAGVAPPFARPIEMLGSEVVRDAEYEQVQRIRLKLGVVDVRIEHRLRRRRPVLLRAARS